MRVRPIRPSDAAALVSFHALLSPDTIYRRYFSPRPTLTEQDVERFTTVDYQDRFAVVAVSDEAIVAVARYEKDGSDSAEVAFVVSDSYQAHGMGSLLLEQLVAAAVERGITQFHADTLVDNVAMQRVFRDARYEVRSSVAAGVVHVDLSLIARRGSDWARAGPNDPRGWSLSRLGPAPADVHHR